MPFEGGWGYGGGNQCRLFKISLDNDMTHVICYMMKDPGMEPIPHPRVLQVRRLAQFL